MINCVLDKIMVFHIKIHSPACGVYHERGCYHVIEEYVGMQAVSPTWLGQT
jgi:hypothetical protein